MKTQVSLERTSLRLWYFRYKDSSLYHMSIIVSIIIISLLLFIYFVMPQISQWFSVQREIADTQTKIATLHQNIQYLSSVNASDLDSRYQLALHALPTEKDVTGILSAISAASVTRNISVGQFTVTPNTSLTGKSKAVQEIGITLTVKGTLGDIRSFLAELSSKLPIIRIKDITYSKDASTVNIVFYSQGIPDISIKRTDLLQQNEAHDNDLLGKLRIWDSQTSGFDSLSFSASGSAIPSPF